MKTAVGPTTRAKPVLAAVAALLLALLWWSAPAGTAQASQAVENTDDGYWEGLDLLGQALREAGYSLTPLGAIPDAPLDGPLLLRVSRPSPDLLRGLWLYIGKGGAAVLPLEVPVNLRDPLLAAVNTLRGDKVVDPDRAYRDDARLPVVTLSVSTLAGGRPLELVLNLPTALTLPDLEGAEVTPIRYGPAAHIVGQAVPEEPLVCALILTMAQGPGRAVIIADYSLMTNQMLPLADNESFVLEVLAFVAGRKPDPGDPAPLYVLGAVLGAVVTTSGGNGGAGGDAEARGLGPFWWTELFALPFALIPLNVYNRRRWLPSLDETSSESRFRSLVRMTTAAADYAVPCRYLAAEVKRVLGRVLEGKVPERLADAAPDCARVVAAENPRTGRFALWRFRLRFSSQLKRLETLAGRKTQVTAGEFVRAYATTQSLLKEIGGIRYYGQGAFRHKRRS